jgi:cardiolipin synthase A/B
VVPFVLISGWIGVSLLTKAYHLHANGKDDNAFNGQSNRIDDNGRPVNSRGEMPLLLREIRGKTPPAGHGAPADRSGEA